MNQCPWIPEMLYRFGDMHLLFDDALGKDGKLSQNGTGENAQDVIEAFKYTFSRPGNHFRHQKSHDFNLSLICMGSLVFLPFVFPLTKEF